MRNIIGEPELILVVFSILFGWMPEGKCDQVHRTMPASHHQHPAQIVEPYACRALPKTGTEQRR